MARNVNRCGGDDCGPVRVEALFDCGASGPRLSDHDGFLVTFELRWPAGVQ